MAAGGELASEGGNVPVLVLPGPCTEWAQRCCIGLGLLFDRVHVHIQAYGLDSLFLSVLSTAWGVLNVLNVPEQ